MSSTRLTCLITAIVLIASTTRAGEPPWVGSEETKTRLTVIGLDGSEKKVVFESPHRLGAPEWSPDGKALVVNSGGKLWKVPARGGKPEPIAIGPAPWIDIDHGLSPDGTSIAFTAGAMLLRAPSRGGKPAQVLPATPSYFHAWSPDGKALAYTANRGGGFDIYAVASDGGAEHQLTSYPGPDDAAAYSADGRWIYFLSDRAEKGNMDLWRMPAGDAGPSDAKAQRITSDDRDDAAPHPSPDGKWLVYLSYAPHTGSNATDRDVLIRRVPLSNRGSKPGKPEDLTRAVGGHGTLGSQPFAPDGKSIVYADFEPPPPTVQVVLFTPSDLAPPSGVAHRLTQIADATERFLFEGMKGWKYPPAVDRVFKRKTDGAVEYVHVKSEKPVADAAYWKASCRGEAVAKAKQQLRIDGEGHLWWVFLYVGDRPKRFSGWEGSGDPRGGGAAIVNYDTIPGQLHPELNPDEGFNSEYFLKGTIHELGHAFGLPHIGPDPTLGLGNSLMGPNRDEYAQRKLAKPDHCYLTEASAAMLWKHPVFSGSTKDRQRQPEAKLADYKPTYSKTANRITLAGRLVSDMPAHSVVVLDDLGKPKDEYFNRSHVARIEPDGRFKVLVEQPARANGHFRIMFCFDNGMVTGDGVGFNNQGAIRKGYKFRNGSYLFGD